MHIESVTAIAFGPFQGATLDLSPQLTVVYGFLPAAEGQRVIVTGLRSLAGRSDLEVL